MKKLIDVEDILLGPMDRYLRDVGVNTEEEKRAYWENYEKERIARDLVNPILLNETIKITDYVLISIFKRKNEKVSIYLNDTAPNGGGGNCELSYVLDYLKIYGKEDMFGMIKAKIENAEKLEQGEHP